MKTKLFLTLTIIIFLPFILFCSSTNGDKSPHGEIEEPEKPVIEIPSAKESVDIVLLYHGDKSRLEWNPDQIEHYVYRKNEDKVDWLFDGFLFVEFHMDINGTDFDFEVDHNHRTSAKKTEWEYLLNKTFAEGHGPDALEKVLDDLAKKGITIP
jgi:hypothetical protein